MYHFYSTFLLSLLTLAYFCAMKYCILRERKTPPDYRSPLNPQQAVDFLKNEDSVEIWAESSPQRCFADADFIQHGLDIENDRQADVYLGIKEVPPADLIPNSTYFFFSHTIKRQAQNLKLLQEVLKKNIRLIDYECLRDSAGQRLIGFGFYAGVVGAYSTLRTFAKKLNLPPLPHTSELGSRAEMDQVLANWSSPDVRILLTGQGRVAQGALSILKQLHFQILPINQPFPTSGRWVKNIDFSDYNVRIADGGFDSQEFFTQPQLYKAHFTPFLAGAQIIMTGHYWSAKSPKFLTPIELANSEVQVVGDISCDIQGPVPSTLRASTLVEPMYGWHRKTFQETDALSPEAIAVMAVDNLPAALPADASSHFGQELLPLLKEFETNPVGPIFQAATIAENGALTPKYAYLQSWVDEKV